MATIRGTNGKDYIVQNKVIAVDIYGYGGNDDILLNRTDVYGGNNYVDAGSGHDKVVNYFEGGNDIRLGTGNDIYIADIRAGGAGEYDRVWGGDGNDWFEVDTFHSVYFGDAGNDTFLSVGFDNSFNGGAGIDTISYELQDEYASQRGKGVTIDLGGKTASTTKGHHEDLISIENATGTNANDDIYGSKGANVLKGRGGSDILEGFAGDDDLWGGSGNDDLYGGSGDDILIGGSGRDYLVGGSGTDTFDFNSVSEIGRGSSRDVIDDFHRSEYDVVDLQSIDADITRGGNQEFNFIGGQSFHGQAGELRFASGILSGDVNGDGRADFEIRMNGVARMYENDFFL